MTPRERYQLFQAGQHTLLAHKVLVKTLRTIKTEDPALHELADSVTLANLTTIAIIQALQHSIPGEPPLDTVSRAPRAKENKTWTSPPRQKSDTTGPNSVPNCQPSTT